MLGPTVGTDQVSYLNTGGYVGSPSFASPNGITIGLDGSHQVNRLLFGAKILYTKRHCETTPSLSLFDPGFSPYRLLRVDTDLQVLTVPLSVGYRLTPESRFHWYIGGTVAAEYLLKTSDLTLLTNTGLITSPSPDKSDYGNSVNIGFGAQTTFRYQLTPLIGAQLEPALRYYLRGGFPTKVYSNYQFQAAFSLLVKV